jgi:argininosuccinate lyase
VTLWEGRLGEPAAQAMAMSVSLSFDRRLAADDVAGSKAHVRGLARGGVITDDEAATLIAALDRVSEELAGQTFVFRSGDEDIHTALERRVTEMAGETGAKLHTGRSRNDQVATALRLYTRRAILQAVAQVLELERVLLVRAEESEEAYLPGYTHMQRAQPVLLAHHLMAHGWALSRDVDRFLDAIARVDVSPLGAGALAGSSLALDPDGAAAELRFRARFDNSLDAVSDRDFVAETLFCLALLGVHLSRIGEEMVIWTTEEFGFARLDDAFATGSSMLPQKKNPDVAELARGKAGRLIGNLTGMLATLKGLPLSYNRDLQEDKEPLFDSLDQMALALPAITGLIETVSFDLDRMRRASDGPAVAAVDLAEWLVENGMPFRKAHGVVASLVRDAVERGVPLEELVIAHPDLGEEALALLEPGIAVNRRTTSGGAGPGPVKIQMERFRARIESDLRRLEETSAVIQPPIVSH